MAVTGISHMNSRIFSAVYFTGCGDDTTIIEAQDVVEDKVVGSIEGIVTSFLTGKPVDSVIVSWVNNGRRDSVLTDEKGYFLIEDELPSGTYELTIEYARNPYTYVRLTVLAFIPTFEDLMGDIDEVVHGIIEYRYHVPGTHLALFPMNATVTGMVYTALPSPAPGKEDGDPMAADSGDLVSPVGGVDVTLDYYGWSSIYPNRYDTSTDANGTYTFVNVPYAPSGVRIIVWPFTVGDSSYAGDTVDITMVHNGTVTVPNIYAPLDCTDIPQVLKKNFSDVIDFGYYDTLKITFSEPMDTISFFAELNPVGDTAWSCTWIWSQNNEVLYLDPLMTLMTDTWYELDVAGQSLDGCPLPSASYDFHVLDGIRLLSTNVQKAPGDYTDFPIDSNIVLAFDMPPVIDPLYGLLKLEDISSVGGPFLVSIDSSVDGNDLIIDPNNPLERNQTYQVSYKMLSSIEGDFVAGTIVFYTEFDTIPPPVVTGFALDMGPVWRADWNTTQIQFQWNTVPEAAGFGYKIYAKDNKGNTDFVVVADITSQDHLQYQEGTVTLPIQFDLYGDDDIQTPFSGGTVIEFDIRAYNRAGEGPFTDSPKSVADETPPGGGDATNDALAIEQAGSADNTTGAGPHTVFLTLYDSLEYVNRTNTAFAFTEDGGDESYALSPTDGFWNWNNSSRNTDLTDLAGIVIPANSCGAGDLVTVTIYDNSGNDTSYTFKLEPYVTITDPVAATTDFEAPDYRIYWTIVDISVDDPPANDTRIDDVDYFLSLDGGSSLIDSLVPFGSGIGGGNAVKTLDDILFSTTTRVGIRDNNGGVIWWSDVFTYNGLIVTGPDSAWCDTALIYDFSNTDSTIVPLAWDYAGIDTGDIWYWDDVISDWTNDTTLENTGSLNWYPRNLGQSYTCSLSVRDTDDGRPRNDLTWDFDVTHDTIDITFPTAGDDLEGGADTTVTWTLVGDITQDIIVEYSADAGNTWVVVDTTKNDSSYVWAVPENSPAAVDEGMLRFRDIHDSNTVAVVGPFEISGLTVLVPNGGEEWIVGSAQTITWDAVNPGGIGAVDIFLSIDDWTTIDTIAEGEVNDGSYPWSVSNRPSTNAKIRIAGTNHAVVDESDDPFTICGVIVTAPNGGENLATGANFTVTWDTVGSDGCDIDNVDIEYSVDGGGWQSIATVANSGSFIWSVPNDPSTDVKIRISKAGVPTSADQSDNPFTISGIIITDPNGGENLTVQTGGSYTITWDKIGVVGTVMIQYSYTGTGGTWYLCQGVGGGGAGSVDPADETFSWDLDPANDTNLPGSTSTTCFIRIKEVTGTIEDLSDVSFTMTVVP